MKKLSDYQKSRLTPRKNWAYENFKKCISFENETLFLGSVAKISVIDSVWDSTLKLDQKT